MKKQTKDQQQSQSSSITILMRGEWERNLLVSRKK